SAGGAGTGHGRSTRDRRSADQRSGAADQRAASADVARASVGWLRGHCAAWATAGSGNIAGKAGRKCTRRYGAGAGNTGGHRIGHSVYLTGCLTHRGHACVRAGRWKGAGLLLLLRRQFARRAIHDGAVGGTRAGADVDGTTAAGTSGSLAESGLLADEHAGGTSLLLL